MLDPAGVLVDRHPVVRELGIEWLLVVMRARVAQEVPGGVDECVHGVGFALCLASALRTRRAPELRIVSQRLVLLRQHHGKLVDGYRHDAVDLAVHDWNRAAPVALPRYEPVAQAVLDRAHAEALLLQPRDDPVETRQAVEAVELAAVHHQARSDVRLVQVVVLAAWRSDDLADRQAELLSECEVALVVRRYGHDRAGAVCHEHVIGDPDRDLLAVDRVDREAAGGDAGLLTLGRQTVDLGFLARLLDVVAHARAIIVRRHLLDQRMLRRQHHERRAEQGVRSRREDADCFAFVAGHRKIDFCALAAPDPVGLHQAHLVRPLVEQLQIVQQTLGIVGDLEEPLLEVALFDLHVRVAPATAIDDLFVGEHGFVHRAPVHRRHRAIREPALVEEQKEPLRPPVVIRHARGDLAIPVVQDPQHLQLARGLGDVVQRPGLRMQASPLDRGVLSRQAERVPAERMQHLEALHALHACEDVAHDVVASVADGEVARRVRVHDQVVVLRLRRAVRRLHHPAFGPDLLPLRLDLLRDIRATSGLCHHVD